MTEIFRIGNLKRAYYRQLSKESLCKFCLMMKSQWFLVVIVAMPLQMVQLWAAWVVGERAQLSRGLLGLAHYVASAWGH